MFPGHQCDADAGEKADQHGARKKIREKAESEEASGQQQAGGEQRDYADERHVLLARGRCHGRQTTRKDGGGRRICGDDQMT